MCTLKKETNSFILIIYMFKNIGRVTVRSTYWSSLISFWAESVTNRVTGIFTKNFLFFWKIVFILWSFWTYLCTIAFKVKFMVNKFEIADTVNWFFSVAHILNCYTLSPGTERFGKLYVHSAKWMMTLIQNVLCKSFVPGIYTGITFLPPFGVACFSTHFYKTKLAECHLCLWFFWMFPSCTWFYILTHESFAEAGSKKWSSTKPSQRNAINDNV